MIFSFKYLKNPKTLSEIYIGKLNTDENKIFAEDNPVSK